MGRAWMEDRIGAYRDLVGRSDGNKPLGRPKCKWENNKMDLPEVG